MSAPANRRSGGLAVVLAVLGVAVLLLAAPAGARPESGRTVRRPAAPAVPAAPRALSVVRAGSGPHRVAVEVDLGSEVKVGCVRFSEDSITGIDALRRAGFDVVTSSFGSGGVAVCALCGKGCAAGSTCLTCQQPYYWAYFHNGVYSPSGASSVVLHDGDLDAWRWGTGEKPTNRSFSSICDEIAATSTSSTFLPALPSTTAPRAPSGGTGAVGSPSPGGSSPSAGAGGAAVPGAAPTDSGAAPSATPAPGDPAAPADPGASTSVPADASSTTRSDRSSKGSNESAAAAAAAGAASGPGTSGGSGSSGGSAVGTLAGLGAVLAAVGVGIVVVRRRRVAT